MFLCDIFFSLYSLRIQFLVISGWDAEEYDICGREGGEEGEKRL